ncbi:MAG: dihydrodipicolinate synthase family protein [Nitrososphaerota archaeon]|nr:dihydrodipicolinate synthase family protein [Nitrososphaerota archaeon]
MKASDISGSITALLTPFNADGRLDTTSLRKIVSFQLEKKAHGIFPVGTTGMGLLMSVEERKKAAEVVIAEVAGKVPVVVHTGAMDTNTTVELSRHAERQGASAVSCITPFFFRSDDATMVRHYKSVAESVSIPVFAYNNPKSSGVNLGMSAVESMQKSGTISGVKESSRDFLRVVEYVERFPKDFVVINGTEGYAFPALMMGVKGMISAVQNIVPELLVSLYELFVRGDFKEAVETQRKITAVKRITDQHGLGALYVILKDRGVECGFPRSPVLPLGSEETEKVLSEWKKVHQL